MSIVKMKKYKILVVDDLKDNLITLVDLIEQNKENWEIFQANRGELACIIAEKEQPDLIIMDWEMPELSGIEATRRIKQNEKTKDIPVIICTGIMTSSEHLEAAFESGAVDFIRKPIDRIELHSRMQSMLLLSESYKNIKALNDYKNKLLSLIAHDLKSPIYTIKLLLDLILDKKINEDKRETILRSVSLSIGSTYSFLENLLSWTNSQRNLVVFAPELFAIYEVIDENIKLLELNAKNKNILIKSQIDASLKINADRNMISTVIRNLLGNAIKYTKNDGNIEISAGIFENQVRIGIRDNGIGISETNVEKILNNQVHHSVSGTLNESGSGIGLQLCHEFLKKHNSQLNIRSKVGEGSHFWFDLPLVKH